ncbi:hypothetical protein RHSP_58759 [Rhizobium freirei PRF 81]|uniref:Uncharacterized protein n=1 Tax=Rhizobium freirei PRF 81 TaxID=363754 RepID=N6U3R8_9HYPH|nr:hypothetical protein RHSP_58759 [Rhizobium freirei PRF 81]
MRRAAHILGRQHRVDNRLFDAVDGCHIDGVERFVVDDLQGKVPIGPVRHRMRIGGRECQEDVAGIVAARRAVAADADGGAASKALELVRCQRQIGGDDDDDRAALLKLALRGAVPQVPANRHARDRQPVPLAVIGLNQRPDRIGPPVELDDAGRGARTALEAVGDHAGAAAAITLLHRACRNAVESGAHVGLADMHSVDIVQRAVIGLCNDGHDPEEIVGLIGRGVMVDHPLDGGVVRHADTMRIGDDDRSEEVAAVFDPVCAGHFAIAVEAMYAGIGGNRRFGAHMRQDRRHPGARRPLAAGTRLVLDDRLKADADAGHVRDGIVCAGAAGKRQAELAAARFAGACFYCHVISAGSEDKGQERPRGRRRSASSPRSH